MDSHTSSAKPIRQMGLPARSRKKYSAARAFYLTIAVILLLAIWSFVIDREATSASSSRVLLLRDATATSEGFYKSTSGLVLRDQEVNELSTIGLLNG